MRRRSYLECTEPTDGQVVQHDDAVSYEVRGDDGRSGSEHQNRLVAETSRLDDPRRLARQLVRPPVRHRGGEKTDAERKLSRRQTQARSEEVPTTGVVESQFSRALRAKRREQAEKQRR